MNFKCGIQKKNTKIYVYLWIASPSARNDAKRIKYSQLIKRLFTSLRGRSPKQSSNCNDFCVITKLLFYRILHTFWDTTSCTSVPGKCLFIVFSIPDRASLIIIPTSFTPLLFRFIKISSLVQRLSLF